MYVIMTLKRHGRTDGQTYGQTDRRLTVGFTFECAHALSRSQFLPDFDEI